MDSTFKDLNFLDLVELDDILPVCEYLDMNECASFENNALNSVIIGHLNIHSVPDKFEDLSELLVTMYEKNLLPDILLLCETFLTRMNYDKYPFAKYHMVSEYRKNKSRGGVSILVNTNIRYNLREDLNVFDEGKFESIFIEIIRNHHSNIIVGEVYRVPGTNESDFLSQYKIIVDKIRSEKRKLLLELIRIWIF